MSRDFEELLRETLREVRAGLPDPQPGLDFWRRVQERPVRRPWWSAHRVQAVAACLVVVVVVGVMVAALQPKGGRPAAPAVSPTGPAEPTVCEPGAAVRPTRTPPPQGQDLTVVDDPGQGAPLDVPAGAWQIDSPAFDAVREVGGCVLAWQLPAGSTVPDGATRVSGSRTKQFTRADPAGRTEVYLVADDGRVYLAVSGDVTAPDLALVLTAAVTAP